MMKYKHYYGKLDSSSQSIYGSILSAWEAHNPNPSFQINSPNINMQKILDCIRYDNPSLFYIDYHSISLSGQGASATLKCNFLYKESQIASMEKQIAAACSEALSAPNFNAMDKFNKELALHDYLVKNVSYASGGDINEITSIAGALISRRAICEGYTKAFMLLCDQAGLPCIFVPGKSTPLNGKEGPHSWNMVNIDGIFSHTDVTWDSTNRGNRDANYDHVNLTDEDIAKDHVWDKSLLPAGAALNNNYHVKNGLYANGIHQFKSCVAAQAEKGEKNISIKFNGRTTVNELIKLSQEALRRVINPVPQVGVMHNPMRNTVFISLR
jgi:hypothetical protein